MSFRALPNLHAVQTVNGTKTSSSAPDKSLNHAVESMFALPTPKLPSANANQPPPPPTQNLAPKVVLKPMFANTMYEDAPPEAASSMHKTSVANNVVANGKSSKVKKSAKKRKAEKQSPDADDDDDDEVSYDPKAKKQVDITESSDSESDDKEDDDEEEDELDSKEETTEDEDEDVDDKDRPTIAKRLTENPRVARTMTKLYDGSTSVDGDGEDVSVDDKDSAEKVFLRTPAGRLLGENVLQGILKCLKNIDPSSNNLHVRQIFTLNMFVKNLLAARCPQLVAQMFGSGPDSGEKEKPEVTKSLDELTRHERFQFSDEITIADPTFSVLAMATSFGLVRRAIVRGVDEKTIVCAFKLDPFKEDRMKDFSELAVKRLGCWSKTAVLAPITTTRYALFEGKTALKPTQSAIRTAGGEANWLISGELTKNPSSAVYIRPKMTPGGAVLYASSRTLLAYNVGLDLRNARAKLTIVPDAVLAALLEAQGEIREKKALANLSSLDAVKGNFTFYVARSVRPPTEELTALVDEALKQYGGSFIANYEQMFVFAHLLFGFLPMQENITSRDADVGPFVYKRMQHDLFDEILGVTKSVKLTLDYNELPVSHVFLAKAKTLELLVSLWNEYLKKIDCKPFCTDAEYHAARQVAAAKNGKIEMVRNYVLSGARKNPPAQTNEPSFEEQVKDMLDSVVRNIFVIV